MFGYLRPITGDVIDGPAFLYDGDFWWTLIGAVIAAAAVTVLIVSLCVRAKKRRAIEKAEEEAKNLSGEE